MDCFLCFQPLKDNQDIVIVGPMDIPLHQSCWEKEEEEE